MSTMFTELTMSKLPRWATDALATDEPPEANKDTGAVQATAFPAKWFNWLQNLNYEWARQNIGTVVSNWKRIIYATGPASSDAVIFNMVDGIWIIVDATGDLWTSYDGFGYTNEAAHGVMPERSIAFDSTHTLLGLNTGAISRRDSGGAVTSIAAGTVGGGGVPIQTIITKYPTSDFVVVTKAGVIRKAPSAGSGSWTAATTPPPAPLVGGVARLVWAGGSVFYLAQGQAGTGNQTYVSADDADTWAATTTSPFAGLATGNIEDMAYNPDDEILVVVGDDDSTEARIEYSEDAGVTWTVATLDLDGAPTSATSSLYSVYYCGNGFWVAGGGGAVTEIYMFVSRDGKNWAPISFDNGRLVTAIRNIHASPRMLTAIDTQGYSVSLGTGAFTP